MKMQYRLALTAALIPTPFIIDAVYRNVPPWAGYPIAAVLVLVFLCALFKVASE